MKSRTSAGSACGGTPTHVVRSGGSAFPIESTWSMGSPSWMDVHVIHSLIFCIIITRLFTQDRTPMSTSTLTTFMLTNRVSFHSLQTCAEHSWVFYRPILIHCLFQLIFTVLCPFRQGMEQQWWQWVEWEFRIFINESTRGHVRYG